MDYINMMRKYRRNTSVESDVDMSGDESVDTFQDYVFLADRENRLIKGIFESAHILEMCPEVVDICILPGGKSKDIATLIQHKLIQAYCWENDIKILELDQAEFNQTVRGHRNKSTDTASIECVLLLTKPTQEIEIDGFENNSPDENIG